MEGVEKKSTNVGYKQVKTLQKGNESCLRLNIVYVMNNGLQKGCIFMHSYTLKYPLKHKKAYLHTDNGLPIHGKLPAHLCIKQHTHIQTNAYVIYLACLLTYKQVFVQMWKDRCVQVIVNVCQNLLLYYGM